MNRRIIAIASGTALLIAAAVGVAVALRNRRKAPPPPDVPVAEAPAEVRVKAVVCKSTAAAGPDMPSTRAVAIVCGMDPATADRYEARNDALRSIARRRDLPKEDVEALTAYLRFPDDALRAERVAALKNDIMNLLRNQDPMPVEGLAETLIAMIDGRPVAGFGRSGRAGVPPPAADGDGTPSLPGNTIHPPAVIDYCIQHLGAMVNELGDATRVGALGDRALPDGGVRGVLVRAARQVKQPYAGTALYSLAEDKRATAAQEWELRRLTLALCKPGVNNVARIAAIQLAGELGCKEALPVLREILSGTRRDAVLDIVSIGSTGLLGDNGDIALLSRFSSDSRRAAAAEAAIKRINEREAVR